MARSDWLRRLLPMAALAFTIGGAGAASVGTPEPTGFVPVWLPRPGQQVPALLNLPPGWNAGDAVVVLAKGADADRAMRATLTAGLLDAGAAVLELDITPADVPALEVILADALAAMRVGHGAGLVVLVGGGSTGEAALRAARLMLTEAGGYNAAAALDAGRPRFARGAPPPLAEAWPARAPLFCTVVSAVLPDAAAVAGLCMRELARE